MATIQQKEGMMKNEVLHKQAASAMKTYDEINHLGDKLSIKLGLLFTAIKILVVLAKDHETRLAELEAKTDVNE